MPGYSFSDYRLRPTNEDDAAHCARWIESDPHHRDRVLPAFFCKPLPGEECYVLEDKFGEPVFYFKMTRALRIDIQFGPAETREEKLRNMLALRDGFEWLAQLARGSGIREMLFQSTHPLLRDFCQKRLGFQASEDELVRAIAPLAPKTAQEIMRTTSTNRHN